MTDGQIRNYIVKLNQNKIDKNLIFLKKISPQVDYAYVWERMPKELENNEQWPYKFYFIKNTDEKYVAAILDTGSRNLYWYVLAKFRKQGFIVKAMKNIILEHLFESREEQFITINPKNGSENLASQRVAELLGFKPVANSKRKNEYSLKYQKTIHKPIGINYKIGKERIDEIMNIVKSLAVRLRMIHSELLQAYGDFECFQNMEWLSEELFKSARNVVEEAWYQFEKKKPK